MWAAIAAGRVIGSNVKVAGTGCRSAAIHVIHQGSPGQSEPRVASDGFEFQCPRSPV